MMSLRKSASSACKYKSASNGAQLVPIGLLYEFGAVIMIMGVLFGVI